MKTPTLVALTLLLTLALSPSLVAAPPPTVYEASGRTAENMDYDQSNKTFIAHAGWLNDKEIHYYKFRIYAPDTYPGRVNTTGAPDIPVAPVYFPSTNGTYAGVPAGQRPILRYHHADGTNYSDFARVHFVLAPPGYEANAWRSFEDILGGDLTAMPTDTIVNMPLVPTGSRLQAPNKTGFAPIKPVMAWYEGEEVQTFVFETTNRTFADLFNPLTREGPAADANSGFEITVSNFATPSKVTAVPIWHLNQYFRGVSPGGPASGGPANTGQRNVVNLDRLDPGYSPLWQIFWVSKLPPNYQANAASNADQLTEANGFKVEALQMYVNCPSVGPHGGGTLNTAKAASFTAEPTLGASERAVLQGALVMEAGRNVTAKVDGQTVGTGTTNRMGGWAIEVPATALDDGANTVTVEGPEGTALQTFTLRKGGGAPAAPTPAPSALLAVAVLVVVGVALRGYRRGG